MTASRTNGERGVDDDPFHHPPLRPACPKAVRARSRDPRARFAWSDPSWPIAIPNLDIVIVVPRWLWIFLVGIPIVGLLGWMFFAFLAR